MVHLFDYIDRSHSFTLNYPKLLESRESFKKHQYCAHFPDTYTHFLRLLDKRKLDYRR